MLSPSRSDAPAAFLDWLERADREGRVFLSVVAIHEIEKGITLIERKGAAAKASVLRAWLDGLISGYSDKIIGLDAATAALSGRSEAAAIAAGHDPGMADAVVAGIAKAHGLQVVTRNARHFRLLGAAVASPDEVVGSRDCGLKRAPSKAQRRKAASP